MSAMLAIPLLLKTDPEAGKRIIDFGAKVFIGAAAFIISVGTTFFFRWRAGGWRKIKLVQEN